MTGWTFILAGMRMKTPARLDIPVVVLTESLESAHAQRVRALGGVPLAPDATDINALVGEVDTLIVVAARGPRALKRRLLDLQELARYYSPDAEGKAQLRRLIDQLQVAIFAVDEHGHCIAASEGVTTLTGYSRQQLLTRSVFEIGFVRGHVSDARWRGLLANRQSAGMTTITTRAGEDVAVHAASVAEISPEFMSPRSLRKHSRAPEAERRRQGPLTPSNTRAGSFGHRGALRWFHARHDSNRLGLRYFGIHALFLTGS